MTESSRVHFRTQRTVRALRVLLLVAVAAVIVGIALTYGRRDRPQAEITMTAPAADIPAAEGPVLDQADRFEITGTRAGRPAFSLQSRTVTGFAGERKLLEEVEMAIHEEDGGSIRIVGNHGQFDPTARQAQLSGDVKIATPDGLTLETGTLYYDSDRDMIFTGDAIRFSLGWMRGTGRGLNYLVADRQIKIPHQVELHLEPEDDGLPITITAGDLVATLSDNTAVFTDHVRLVRGGDILVSDYLELQFDEARHHVTTIRTFGDVHATLAPGPDGRVSALSADSLVVNLLTPSDVIDRAEASGDCQFTSGPFTSHSRTALFLRREDRLELRGDPLVFTDRNRIAAQEIDLRPGRQTLEARGDVRTVSLPNSQREDSTPGFGNGVVSFQAAELRADQVAQRAVYVGSARAWQGGNSLQAAEIVVDYAARQIRASGQVVSRWMTTETHDTTMQARPEVTMITSQSLVLDHQRGTGRYNGEVKLTHPEATMTADVLDTFLSTDGSRRALDRIEAFGSVEVHLDGSLGTAETARLLNSQSALILQDEGGLAEVVDTATGRSMRGRTLTYDLAGDRILTETERGGRTWITLDPESKDAPTVEP